MEKSTRKLFEEANQLIDEQGNVDAAIKLYKKILASNPSDSFATYARTQIAMIENIKLKEKQAQVEKKRMQERKKIEDLGDSFLYERFTKEIEGDDVDSAVWSKALTIHYGDEDKAKYEYVQLKVDDAKASLGLLVNESPERVTNKTVSVTAEPKGNTNAVKTEQTNRRYSDSRFTGLSPQPENVPTKDSAPPALRSPNGTTERSRQVVSEENSAFYGGSGWFGALLPSFVVAVMYADSVSYHPGEMLGSFAFPVVTGLFIGVVIKGVSKRQHHNRLLLKKSVFWTGILVFIFSLTAYLNG